MKLRVASFLSPNLYPLYFFVAESISRHLEVAGLEFIEGSTFEEFQSDNFDLAFACGYWYAHQTEKYHPIAAPVLADPRYQDAPHYFVDVVVAADSPFQFFGQLAGKRFAYNEAQSFSGYHALRSELGGQKLAAFTGEKIKTGSHVRSIETVLRQGADFATLDSTVLAQEIKARPAVADRLRVVTSFGPYPAPPLLVNREIPTDLQNRITNIVENLPADELARFGLKSYRRVDAADYARYGELVSCC